jgi:hypothetical protein
LSIIVRHLGNEPGSRNCRLTGRDQAGPRSDD